MRHRLDIPGSRGVYANQGKAEAVPECVELLLRHKADLSLEDVWGRTPLQVVLRHRRAGLHFSTNPTRVITRIVTLAEQCAEIMGAASMATMTSPSTEAAKLGQFPGCNECEGSLSLMEQRRRGSCFSCWCKRFIVWCVECDDWRRLVADSEAAAKKCSECRVTVQRSRYFCQGCGNPHTDCECRYPPCAACGTPREKRR